jgi:predicted restriction endonuclease
MKYYDLIDILTLYEIDHFGQIHRNSSIIDSKNGQGDFQDPFSPPEYVRVEIIRRIRETKKSKELKQRYGDVCQICGKVIKMMGRNYSETHHLKPLGGDHKGPDDISNMIVVCPNHHAELDFGSICIDPKTFQIISWDGNIIGKLHVLNSHIIRTEYLEYHRKNIFIKGKLVNSNS